MRNCGRNRTAPPALRAPLPAVPRELPALPRRSARRGDCGIWRRSGGRGTGTFCSRSRRPTAAFAGGIWTTRGCPATSITPASRCGRWRSWGRSRSPSPGRSPPPGRWPGSSHTHDPLRLGAIDLVSWLYAAVVVQASGGGRSAGATPRRTGRNGWRAGWRRNRSADGGYAKTPAGAAGSTYTSFLVALTLELIGRSVPAPGRLAQFLYDMQRDDGGFVEIAPVRRSGANPTAAAAVLLKLLGHVDGELNADLRGFLDRGDRSVRRRAGQHPHPLPRRVEHLHRPADVPGPRRARPAAGGESAGLGGGSELELPTGGFRGAAWDTHADAEYTFYGLGLLALTAPRPPLDLTTGSN